MVASDPRPTLCLSARFPREASFASTAGELASRLAVAAGVGEAGAAELGRSVESAFGAAVRATGDAAGSDIEVTLCTGDATLDVSVSSGPAMLFAISHPRPQSS
ncbi:MAG: hypothetical protein WCP29_18690 [Acidobacteriota bacterium]